MFKKAINLFISISFLFPFFAGITTFPQVVNNYYSSSFQKTCDMVDCNPYMPKCPLCPSSSSINLYFHHGVETYMPAFTSSPVLIDLYILSDQGFVKTIFHPPTTTSQSYPHPFAILYPNFHFPKGSREDLFLSFWKFRLWKIEE